MLIIVICWCVLAIEVHNIVSGTTIVKLYGLEV